MGRIILVLLVALLFGAVAAAPAASDPVGTPTATTFTITCELNGGQTTFQVVSTGFGFAGHDLDSTGVFVLFSGTRRIFVNGVLVDEFSFGAATKATGLPLSTCAAFAEFQNEQGQTVRIELTDAKVLIAPPG